MTLPTVSICIPTFERLPYLQEAVQSARAQTDPNVEIVIGDDGDSAELRAWCLSQTQIDGRVRYAKTPQRLRLAGNWNFLAGLARGEYLTLMGDDDRLLPRFVEVLRAATSPQVAVVFANHYLIDSSGRRMELESQALTRRYSRSELPAGPLADPEMQVWRNSVPMSASMVRADVVRRYAFKNDINTPELELFARLAADGEGFAFVPDYLAEYRTHGASETSRGLTVDRLAEYLEPIHVPEFVEPVKRACMRQLLLGGTSARLARGDREGARRLIASPYYPRGWTESTALAQRLALALPEELMGPGYRLAQTFGRAVRRSADKISSRR